MTHSRDKNITHKTGNFNTTDGRRSKGGGRFLHTEHYAKRYAGDFDRSLRVLQKGRVNCGQTLEVPAQKGTQQ